MKLILGSAAILSAVIAAAPAAAQDTDPNSWTGFYVGGAIGYSFQPKDNNETILFDNNRDGTFGDRVFTAANPAGDAFAPGFCGGAAITNVPAGGCRDDKDGLAWQVQAGFDYQIGQSIVLGVVGDYGRSTINDSVTGYSATPFSYTITRRLRDNASLRARAGFSLGSTLLYGTGGGAYGKVRHQFVPGNPNQAFTETGTSEKAWGYTYGGGIEQKVAPNFSIGAQYLYTSLKTNDYRLNLTGGAFSLVNAGGTEFRRSSDRFGFHKAQVTANFRF